MKGCLNCEKREVCKYWSELLDGVEKVVVILVRQGLDGESEEKCFRKKLRGVASECCGGENCVEFIVRDKTNGTN
jgi:hypothetical protein